MQLRDPNNPSLLGTPTSSIGQALDPGADLANTLITGEVGQPAGTDAMNQANADTNTLEQGMFTSSPGIVGVSDGPTGSGPAGGGGGGAGGAGRGVGGTRGALAPGILTGIAPIAGTPAPAAGTPPAAVQRPAVMPNPTPYNPAARDVALRALGSTPAAIATPATPAPGTGTAAVPATPAVPAATPPGASSSVAAAGAQSKVPPMADDYSNAFDEFDAADRKVQQQPAEQMPDGEAERLEAIRIKKMRKSRLGG